MPHLHDPSPRDRSPRGGAVCWRNTGAWLHGPALEHVDTVVVDREWLLVRRLPLLQVLRLEEPGVALARSCPSTRAPGTRASRRRRSRGTTHRVQPRSGRHGRRPGPRPRRGSSGTSPRAAGSDAACRARPPVDRSPPTSSIPRGRATRRCGSRARSRAAWIAVPRRTRSRSGKDVTQPATCVVAKQREPAAECTRDDSRERPVPGTSVMPSSSR